VTATLAAGYPSIDTITVWTVVVVCAALAFGAAAAAWGRRGGRRG